MALVFHRYLNIPPACPFFIHILQNYFSQVPKYPNEKNLKSDDTLFVNMFLFYETTRKNIVDRRTLR